MKAGFHVFKSALIPSMFSRTANTTTSTMADTDSSKNFSQLPSLEDSEDSQQCSSSEASPQAGSLENEGNTGGGLRAVRRSNRRRMQRGPRDRDLVANFLSGGKGPKKIPTGGKATGRKGFGGRRVARMRGQEYRVQGLDGVRHRLGQPIEFKVNWVPTWVPFHDLRGEDLFEEARGAIKETLGYSTWEAQEGPVSHVAALELNEEVEYESQ